MASNVPTGSAPASTPTRHASAATAPRDRVPHDSAPAHGEIKGAFGTIRHTDELNTRLRQAIDQLREEAALAAR